jgi:hypothetical protein
VFGGATGLLGSIFAGRKARLDADRDQHHLASMLISIASGSDEVSRDEIRDLLRSRAKGAQATVRINHAVKLAGTAVSGELYDKVVALAREFTA